MVMNSLNNMPLLVRKTNEPDMQIVEDEKFLAIQEQHNLELIQSKYKEKIQNLESNSSIDPKVKHRLYYQHKFRLAQDKKEAELQ